MGSSPSRGENRTDDCHKITKRGSSPLTQGKLFRVPGHAAALGRIPAHAGEIKADAITNYLYFGSTPLTRGKLNLRSRNNQRLGLIPTHARKTARAPPSYQ